MSPSTPTTRKGMTASLDKTARQSRPWQQAIHRAGQHHGTHLHVSWRTMSESENRPRFRQPQQQSQASNGAAGWVADTPSVRWQPATPNNPNRYPFMPFIFLPAELKNAPLSEHIQCHQYHPAWMDSPENSQPPKIHSVLQQHEGFDIDRFCSTDQTPGQFNVRPAGHRRIMPVSTVVFPHFSRFSAKNSVFFMTSTMIKVSISRIVVSVYGSLYVVQATTTAGREHACATG